MEISLYSPRINEIKRYAPQDRIQRVMEATGCTNQEAIEYLVAEEGDEADAIKSYRTDRQCPTTRTRAGAHPPRHSYSG